MDRIEYQIEFEYNNKKIVITDSTRKGVQAYTMLWFSENTNAFVSLTTMRIYLLYTEKTKKESEIIPFKTRAIVRERVEPVMEKEWAG